MGSIILGSMPYVFLMIGALFLVMLWPQIALVLPETMLNLR
jgi:TRAP-type C4-dicarboxylate transport system permease large subunit